MPALYVRTINHGYVRKVHKIFSRREFKATFGGRIADGGWRPKGCACIIAQKRRDGIFVRLKNKPLHVHTIYICVCVYVYKLYMCVCVYTHKHIHVDECVCVCVKYTCLFVFACFCVRLVLCIVCCPLDRLTAVLLPSIARHAHI